MKRILSALTLIALVFVFTGGFMATSAPESFAANQPAAVTEGVLIATDEWAGIIDGSGNLVKNDKAGSIGKIITEYKEALTYITGFATITMIAFFIINLVKLGASSTDPMKRKMAISALIWTFIAVALLGSITTILVFALNSLGFVTTS